MILQVPITQANIALFGNHEMLRANDADVSSCVMLDHTDSAENEGNILQGFKSAIECTSQT